MADILEKDKSKGHSILAACAGTCLGITNHTVSASMDRSGSYDDIDWMNNYQIIICEGCKKLSFRQASSTSDDYVQVGENEWEVDEHVKLFPPRKAGAVGLGKDVSRLPDTLANLYEETKTTLVNATPVLAGIGLRALVETVCNEKNSPGKNLAQQIDGLVVMGILTKIHANVLHEIRSMGNEAAHEAKPHSDEQLQLAMDVVEHLLNSVYVIPFKLQKFAKPKPVPMKTAAVAAPAKPAALPAPVKATAAKKAVAKKAPPKTT